MLFKFNISQGLTPEQKGNDLAASVAKDFLRQGQSKPADQYFMEAEECFILKHKENNVQSDIRVYLKSLEKIE